MCQSATATSHLIYLGHISHSATWGTHSLPHTSPTTTSQCPCCLPWGYFVAFSPFGSEGKRKKWLVMEIDQIANPHLPFWVIFEIPQKLQTILEITDVKSDLKSMSQSRRYSHF
jgi:hypothetical protein